MVVITFTVKVIRVSGCLKNGYNVITIKYYNEGFSTMIICRV